MQILTRLQPEDLVKIRVSGTRAVVESVCHTTQKVTVRIAGNAIVRCTISDLAVR